MEEEENEADDVNDEDEDGDENEDGKGEEDEDGDGEKNAWWRGALKAKPGMATKEYCTVMS